MNITFSIEWLFFIVPIVFLIIGAQGISNNGSYLGSSRDWYYMFMTPVALVIAFASWAIYLRWFK
jgi:hypothetical protein